MGRGKPSTWVAEIVDWLAARDQAVATQMFDNLNRSNIQALREVRRQRWKAG